MLDVEDAADYCDMEYFTVFKFNTVNQIHIYKALLHHFMKKGGK